MSRDEGGRTASLVVSGGCEVALGANVAAIELGGVEGAVDAIFEAGAEHEAGVDLGAAEACEVRLGLPDDDAADEPAGEVGEVVAGDEAGKFAHREADARGLAAEQLVVAGGGSEGHHLDHVSHLGSLSGRWAVPAGTSVAHRVARADGASHTDARGQPKDGADGAPFGGRRGRRGRIVRWTSPSCAEG